MREVENYKYPWDHSLLNEKIVVPTPEPVAEFIFSDRLQLGCGFKLNVEHRSHFPTGPNLNIDPVKIEIRRTERVSSTSGHTRNVRARQRLLAVVL